MVIEADTWPFQGVRSGCRSGAGAAAPLVRLDQLPPSLKLRVTSGLVYPSAGSGLAGTFTFTGFFMKRET